MARKGDLYHSVIKGIPLAMLLLPWQMSAPLAAIVSFFLLYYRGTEKGGGADGRQRKVEARGERQTLDFLKMFIAATSCLCPHCFCTCFCTVG